MLATIYGYDQDDNEIFCCDVEVTDGKDIYEFPPEFDSFEKPYYMIAEINGLEYPCCSWRDYELGTRLTSAGANSNDFADWDEYNEWVVSCIEQFASCEPEFVLFANEVDPFI